MKGFRKFLSVFRVHFRHKCWELGAFTSTSLEDPVITHLLVPKSFPREGQVNLVCFESSCFLTVFFFQGGSDI